MTKTDSKKIKIFNVQLTLKQLVIVIILISILVWFLFNFSFSIKTDSFSCSSKPANVETDHIKIDHAQNKK